MERKFLPTEIKTVNVKEIVTIDSDSKMVGVVSAVFQDMVEMSFNIIENDDGTHQAYGPGRYFKEDDEGGGDWRFKVTVKTSEDDPYMKQVGSFKEIEAAMCAIWLLGTENYRREIKLRKEEQQRNTRNCANCRYATTMQVPVDDEGVTSPDRATDKTATRRVCALTGDTLDDKTRERRVNNQKTDKGLMHKKSQAMYSKEHPNFSPTGRDRMKSRSQKRQDDLKEQSCFYHSFLFRLDNGEWVDQRPSPLFPFHRDGDEIWIDDIIVQGIEKAVMDYRRKNKKVEEPKEAKTDVSSGLRNEIINRYKQCETKEQVKSMLKNLKNVRDTDISLKDMALVIKNYKENEKSKRKERV